MYCFLKIQIYRLNVKLVTSRFKNSNWIRVNLSPGENFTLTSLTVSSVIQNNIVTDGFEILCNGKLGDFSNHI